MTSTATVTVRELKNKETGIDLSVTSFKETKGMLGSTYEYQIMVVSNLPYFKSAKHRDAANVQFTILKKMADFEELYAKLNTKYSGTVLPVMPKKVLIMNEAVARDRRNSFHSLLKFLASTPKLCMDPVLLVFLGVSTLKASSDKLKKLVVSDKTVDNEDKTEEQTVHIGGIDAADKLEPEDDENLFATADGGKSEDDDEEDIFADNITPSKVETKLFDDPDLSGAMEEGEGDDLFIEGSRSEVNTSKVKVTDDAESNDLFSSDDELDNIMSMKISSKPGEDNTENLVQSASPVEDNLAIPSANSSTEDTNSIELPNIDNSKTVDESSAKTESSVDKASKSINPIKPKPGIRPKPTVPKRGEHLTQTKSKSSESTDLLLEVNDRKLQGSGDAKVKPKPPLRQKPTLAKKPDIKADSQNVPMNADKVKAGDSKDTADNAPVESSKVKAGDSKDTTSVVAELTESDIMKYIQDNAAPEDDDLDLFS